MIECYFKWCPNHEINHLPKDVSGPFCNNDECTAHPDQITCYTIWRREELKSWGLRMDKYVPD